MASIQRSICFATPTTGIFLRLFIDVHGNRKRLLKLINAVVKIGAIKSMEEYRPQYS